MIFLSSEKADSDEVKKSMWFSANFRYLIQLLVDEEHLVDEWCLYRVFLKYIVTNFFRGKEFRASYGQLGDIRGVFGKRPPRFIT